jgi:5-methylcytosine-specific restriction enzyme subunit McrC
MDAILGDMPDDVVGLILYAKTDETMQPDAEYRMSGNKISVKTLDLNCEFHVIATQLNTIAKKYFGEVVI